MKTESKAWKESMLCMLYPSAQRSRGQWWQQWAHTWLCAGQLWPSSAQTFCYWVSRLSGFFNPLFASNEVFFTAFWLPKRLWKICNKVQENQHSYKIILQIMHTQCNVLLLIWKAPSSIYKRPRFSSAPDNLCLLPPKLWIGFGLGFEWIRK